MPELPEVETVRRTLAPLVGMRVVSVWGSGLPLRQNRPVHLAKIRRALRGRTVEQIRRRGKYLVVDFSGRSSLLVHLGMSGRLRLVEGGAARAPHTHLVWAMQGDGGRVREVRYSDPRRFGRVELIPRDGDDRVPALANLGLDPLTDIVTGEILRRAARGSRRSIKSLLLDQRVLAGVGNIYACEALWEAGIRPTWAAGRLASGRCDRLAEAVTSVLCRALEHGGTTLRDFLAADGAVGEHVHHLCVYGREGESCHRRPCRGVIRRTALHGRATFWCPRCQT